MDGSEEEGEVMERSSYLEFFHKESLGQPYGSRSEALEEEYASLRVLMQLFEQKRAGVISMEFASRDWTLTRFHLEGRGEASAPLGRIFCLLGLNGGERTALLLSLAAQEGRITGEELSRLREDRKKETASLEAARLLAGFLGELEGESGKRAGQIRQEKAELLFQDGWKTAPLQAESPLIPRPRILEEIWGDGEERELSGVLKAFCHRRSRKEKLPALQVHGDLLSKLQGMCRNTGEMEKWTLCLLGSRGSGRELLACHLAAFLGRELLAADESRLERQPLMDGIQEAERELLLECLLSGSLLYMTHPEKSSFYRLRRELPGLILTGILPEELEEGRSLEEKECSAGFLLEESICLELPQPTADQKARLWESFLNGCGHEEGMDPRALGSKYVLNAGGIQRALYAAKKWASGDGRDQITKDDIAWAVHQSQAGQLGSFATRVECVFGWEDLIVEEKARRQLLHICGQMKYRSVVGNQWGFFEKMPYGRGLSALFYGPPGTGKTMAVQVIAKDLGLDLYRVDLSRMVSKYIGETEKNISALFDKAKHMNVILFFDEADSFFSRRSEVKDSNDRSANAEVAHLLQKLEEYEGITILATNLKENIDDAFKRRIRFMVNFRFPSAETRRTLWHSLLPKAAPRSRDLDLDFFADQFELSGSQIKEILLNAAYMAAGTGEPLGTSQIKEALCINYEKYGKFLTKEDFGYLG